MAIIAMHLNTRLTPWSPSRVLKVPYYDKRGKKRVAYNPKDNQKKATQALILSLRKRPPFEGYVNIFFEFYFQPPKSLSKRNRALYLENNRYRPTRCDATNLQKFYEDCIKNILITDDRNVVKITSEKLYAEKEGVLITIYPVGDHENIE